MRIRRFALLAMMFAGLLIGGLLANVTLQDRWSLQAARDSLPEAKRFLDDMPAYRHLSVVASDAEGGALWFQGTLPTNDDERAFTQAAKARFGDRGFRIIAIIFYDESGTPNTQPTH